jgi:hypothetical protein
MVPTLLLFGLVLGRWWRTTLLAALIGWPLLLLVTTAIEPGWTILGAAAIGVVNTGVGVLIHQAVLWWLRTWRPSR